MRAEAWASWAAWATFAVAVIAAIIALRQLGEAKTTREKAAQPNVVAYLEATPNAWGYVDFVVKNYGQTPAYDVRLKLPTLTVVPYDNVATGAHVTELAIPSQLVVLAPWQEWRTLWGSLQERNEHNRDDAEHALNDVFVGRVEFQGDEHLDPKKKPYSNPVYLDWKHFNQLIRAEQHTETITRRL